MFFSYRQKNSFGVFEGPYYTVYIEADNANQADGIAITHPDSPIYFDGVEDGEDCPCCGDRWTESYANEPDGYRVFEDFDAVVNRIDEVKRISFTSFLHRGLGILIIFKDGSTKVIVDDTQKD